MKQLLIFLSLVLFGIAGYSQREPEARDLFLRNDAPIIWLGLDFTRVQLVGELSDVEEGKEHTIEELKSRYFENWNRLVIKEEYKFNVDKMMRKEGVTINLKHTSSINKSDSVSQVKQVAVAKEFNIHTIEEMLEYRVFDTVPETIGLMLIVEKLDKTNKEAAFHFVAFSIESKNILIHKRIVTHPSGFGFESYWANAIAGVFGLVKDQYYGNWKQKYFKK